MTTSPVRRKRSSSASDTDKWQKARETVKSHAEELRAMTSHGDLYQFAVDQHLNTTSLFPKFKSELWKQLDISYDDIRSSALRARAAEIAEAAQSAPWVTLYTHGDAEVSAYAVCGEQGENAWYGEFHAEDREFRGDQTSADISAAAKAVFLAGQVRSELELPAIRLRLCTPNHEVDQEQLAAAATRARVAVTIEVVEDNPAVEVVRLPGWQSWREIRLRDLITESGDST